MAQANERKGVLRHVWSDRIVPALLPGDQKLGREDSSNTDDTRSPTHDEHSAGQQTGDAPEQRILTPSERILELVAEHGGRMKQAEIVSHCSWSESTVSRKLKKLEASGGVIRCRLGREKLVYLPGREPEALQSPFAEPEEEAPLAH